MGKMEEWGWGECWGEDLMAGPGGMAAGVRLRGFNGGVQPQNGGNWLTLCSGEAGAIWSPSSVAGQDAVPSWVDDY